MLYKRFNGFKQNILIISLLLLVIGVTASHCGCGSEPELPTVKGNLIKEDIIELAEKASKRFPFLAKKLKELKVQSDSINIDERDSGSSDETALHQAVHLGDENILRVLIAKGANVTLLAQTKRNLLHQAAIHGDNLRILQILLTYPIDVNGVDNYQNTPLHYAASLHNQPAFIQALINKGADINAIGEHQETALYKAIKQRKLASVRTLLQYQNIDVNQADQNDKNPLHVAVVNFDLEAVKLLIAHKNLKLDLIDQTLTSPLQLATTNLALLQRTNARPEAIASCQAIIKLLEARQNL